MRPYGDKITKIRGKVLKKEEFGCVIEFINKFKGNNEKFVPNHVIENNMDDLDENKEVDLTIPTWYLYRMRIIPFSH